MAEILLVEDEQKYIETLTKILTDMGHDVTATTDVVKGLEFFQTKRFDLVISDLMMEVMDGVRFLSFIKRMNPAVKTIILTGFPTTDTELAALDIHVDYYLSKELRQEVFVKYIENVLANPIEAYDMVQTATKLVSVRESIEIDLKEHIVYKYGVPVELTVKEFQILIYFLKNKQAAISREQIINTLWDCDHELVNYRVVDSHIKSLRRKLNIISLQSIRGVGYKWNE